MSMLLAKIMKFPHAKSNVITGRLLYMKKIFNVCSEKKVTDTPHHLLMYIHPLCFREVYLHHLHSRWYIILTLCWKGIKTARPTFTFLCKVQIQYRLVN